MTTGYHDHHVHFLASVAARLSIDVSSATTISELGMRIESAAAPGTGWLRAWGYDETFLGDGRHPTRDDLDRCCRDRPLVLHHRTGHAAVLNSIALAELGAEDQADGILVDRHDLLERVPRLPATTMAAAAAAVSREWQRSGVAGFTDATHTNGAEELELLARWRRTGVIAQHVTAMVGMSALGRVPATGERVGEVEVGHAKLMPRDADPDPIGEAVRRARRHHAPIAVHVTDIDVLDAVLGALERWPSSLATPDRIEHNALSLPEQVPRIAGVGATVVVNPSFLLHRAAKYRRELSAVEHRWLIRIRSLTTLGVTVRAGSDSPVTPSVPAEMIDGAMRHPFSPSERVDRATAERMCRHLDAEPDPPRRR